MVNILLNLHSTDAGRVTRATPESWQTRPLPALRAALSFSSTFSPAEAEAIMLGSIPHDMDEKWFICFHDGWLLFYRSWTGCCIFGLRLEQSSAGALVADSWVNRDPAQYTGSDIQYERTLVRDLIDDLLLCRPTQDPKRTV